MKGYKKNVGLDMTGPCGVRASEKKPLSFSFYKNNSK